MIRQIFLAALTIVLGVNCLLVGSAEADNLLQNPSFEEGLRDWTVPPSYWLMGKNVRQPETDEALVQGLGMASLKMAGQVGKRGCIFQNVVHNPEIKNYRISGWMKIQNFDPHWKGRILVVCLNKEGGWLKTTSLTTPLTYDMDWQKFEKEFAVPEGTQTIRVILETIHKSGKYLVTPPNTGSAWFDNIGLGELIDIGENKNNVSLNKIYPLGEKGIFIQGEPIEFALEIISSAAQNKQVELNITIKDFFEKIVYQREGETLVLRPHEIYRHKLELPAPKLLGFYSVHLELKTDQILALEAVSSFCVVQTYRGDNDPFFGVSAFRVTKYMARAMRLIGVGTVPVAGNWGDIEKEKGVFDWERMDLLVDLFLEKGFRVLGFNLNQQPSLSHPWITPYWARREAEMRREQGRIPYPAEHFQHYARFVENMVARYKDRIRMWSIMNEIDIPMRDSSVADEALAYYAKMVAAFSQAARKVDPEIIIGGVGVAAPDCFSVPRFPTARRIWGVVHPYLDAKFFNPHLMPRTFGPRHRPAIPETAGLRDVLLEAVKLAQRYGKGIIGIDEKGAAMVPGLPINSPYAKDMAKVLSRNLIISKSVPEVERFLHFTVNQCTLACGCYGLWKLMGGGGLENFLRFADEPAWPTPSVAAYATVANLLRHTTQPEELNIHKSIFGYAFRRKDHSSIIPLWTILREPVSLLIEIPKEAYLYNLMGNKIKTLLPGMNELILTEAPVFLASTTAGDELVRAVSKASFSLPLIRAGARLASTDSLVLDILNQVDRDLKAQIEIKPLEGADLITKKKQVTIPAQKRLSVEFGLTNTDISILNKSKLYAKIIVEGRTTTVEKSFNLHPVFRSRKEITIDGNLSEFKHLSPILVASGGFIAPIDALPARLWTGPDDLSFKVWVTYDEKYFYFAASVTDDKFVQERTGRMTWANDSLGLAFDTLNDALSPEIAGIRGYDANDYEFYIALTREGPQTYCWVAAQARKELARRLMEFPLSIKRINETTTNYELAIPWDALFPLKPEPGRTFGFNFVYSDADRPGEEFASYWMGLTSGIHGGKDPSAFKTFILIP